MSRSLPSAWFFTCSCTLCSLPTAHAPGPLSFSGLRHTLYALQDALESAMKSGLWGHALLLASKMDSRTHARVMTR